MSETNTTLYVGIDLAWGRKNTTAVVVLAGTGDPRDGAELTATADALLTDDEIIAFIEKHDIPKGGLIAAIDAPTIVPNESGRRPCEAILSRCLHKQQAGPHPANRRLLAGDDGLLRGERLVKRLTIIGVPETPYLDRLAPPIRACFEAFPHPAHVALFGLEKTLKYKAKPKRTLPFRLAEFARYADYLAALALADPSLRFSTDDPAPWWQQDISSLAPAALKRYEDALDALTCAYIALYRHRWGDERSVVIGNTTQGYIVTPATDAMRLCFTAEAATVSGTMENGGVDTVIVRPLQ